MKIDLPKLQRLEEAARRENLALRDLEERYNHARKEWNRRLGVLVDVEFSSLSPSPMHLWVECDRDPDRFLAECSARTADTYVSAARMMREILHLRDEASRLGALREGQAERWRRSAAALPALREFAKQFRPTYEGTAGVRVEGEETRGANLFRSLFGGQI